MQSFKISTEKEHIVDQDNLNMAIEIWSKIMTTDWFLERPKDVQELYIKYPPWKFYTNQDGTIARRIYGISEYTNKETNTSELRLEVASGMMMMTNLVVGGVLPEDIIEVEKYSDIAYTKLMINPGRDSFLLSTGFMDFSST